jgi:hypothetical protein
MRKLEKEACASSSVFAKASIEELMPPLVARIQKTRVQVCAGKSGVLLTDVNQCLSGIDTESVAQITLKALFDFAFSFVEENKRVVKIPSVIGLAIEAECQMQFYEQAGLVPLKTSNASTGISLLVCSSGFV